VHHVAVVFQEELVGDADTAEFRDPAGIVAAEIEQHEVLGALLGIGEKLRAQALVLLGCFAAGACRRSGVW
jgi:hypothetical protein